MRFNYLLAAATVMVSCAPAQAAWHEASSDHFVIYADDSERDITTFAQQLEKYHAGLALVTGSAPAVPSPSNRVTVYVVRDEREVRALYGNSKSSVAGFYVPRASGSMAIVPSVRAGNGTISWSMLVLLHEYAHHFLISTNPREMPRWLSEGAAEFFASAQFEKDGSMWLGRPARHRAAGLVYVTNVEAADVLDPAEAERHTGISEDAFYGKSWLLYHFLTFEPSRKGQFDRYLRLLADGKGLRDAATQAFGDLAVLEKDLDRYQDRLRLSALKLGPERLTFGAVHVRALTAGEAAMMPVRVRSKKGVSSEGDEAAKLLSDAKAIAARYPGDAAVLSALAECEHDAGHDNEAVAAADAAIKLDPKQVNAYVQKGLALFRQAADAEDKAAAYKKARAPFIALNTLENDHPLPLIYFYRSFAEKGKQPPALAVDGLIRAVELAPFDMGLRMNLGLALLRLGRGPESAIIFRPVAYNPHGGPMAAAARGIIDRIEKEPKWKGEGLGEPPQDAPGTPAS
jgi:tetratricopeptide (TPR) repeat protein